MRSAQLISGTKFLFLALLLSAGLQASVSVNFVSTGPNNVLPYTITLDGLTTSAVCYDDFDNVPNPPWIADLLTIYQAADHGFFSADPNALVHYQEVAWLSQQPFANVPQEVDLQQTIWNVFDNVFGPPPAAFPVDAGMQAYMDALAAAELAGFPGFNFDALVFIEQKDHKFGQPGTDQAFVALISTLPPSIVAVPEPKSAMLTAGALMLALSAIYVNKRRKALGN